MRIHSLVVTLLAVAGALGALAIGATPAEAQRFYELAGGWNAVAQATSSSSDRFQSGPYLRGSVGLSVAPRARIRFDGDAILLDRGYRDPIGEQIGVGLLAFHVIGAVAPTRYRDLLAPRATLYMPYA